MTLLTDGKSRNTGALWANGGKWIAYGSTRRTGNDVDIYVVEASNPKNERRILELTGGGWSVNDWSPDDAKLLVTEAISINETYLWLADVAAGTKALLTPKEGQDRLRQPVSARTQGLYVSLTRVLEFQRSPTWTPTKKSDFYGDPPTSTTSTSPTMHDARLRHQRERAASSTSSHGFPPRLPGPKLPLGVVSVLRGRDGGASIHHGDGSRNSYAYSGRPRRKLERCTTSVWSALTARPRRAGCVFWRASTAAISRFSLRPNPASFPGKRPVNRNHVGPRQRARFSGICNTSSTSSVAVVCPRPGSTGYGKTFCGSTRHAAEGPYKEAARSSTGSVVGRSRRRRSWSELQLRRSLRWRSYL